MKLWDVLMLAVVIGAIALLIAPETVFGAGTGVVRGVETLARAALSSGNAPAR